MINMSMEDYKEPDACGLSRDDVFSLAADAADIFDYKPGTSLQAVVKKLGGEVEFVSDGTINKTQDGSILINGLEDFKIFLADDVGPARQRFTLAHELGHLVLHYVMAKEEQPIRAHRYGSGRAEWEANWFAAGFLMPEKEFRASYKRYDGNLTDIADEFGVSYSAVCIRADQLGLGS